MFKTLTRGTVVASLLAFMAVLGGMPASGSSARAQGLDPESVVVAFVEALNAGQGEAAAALYAPDAIFTDIDGGSFAAVGHPAISFIFEDATSDPDFHLEIIDISASGDTVTGVTEVTDAGAVAAGVDRYIQPFTFIVIDGKITETHLTYDASDPQTQTYLDFISAEEGGDDEPAQFVEVTLEGSQPGSAFVADFSEFGATGVAGLSVFLEASSGRQAANVYEGTCDALGAVASRLAVLSEGGSFSIVSLDYGHLTTEPHAIAVSASESDSTVVSCANIAAAAAGPTSPGLPNTGMGASSTGGARFASLAFALALLGAVAVVGTGAARVARRP